MPLEMWGGVECTINRVGDRFLSQIDRSGHDQRIGDLERFASLGIRAIRYPVLWESTAPDGVDQADWTFADSRLEALQRLGMTPIVGLVHHGSGPLHTDLLDPGFADGLARFAAAVAQRFPWIEYWTPVNEPITTARFSCLYALWFPHEQNDRAFVAAVLNQCRGTVLAMRAIRAVNPGAKLIQTDDISRTDGTPAMADKIAFYNARRWLAWDLLCGRVTSRHPLWSYLIESGAEPSELDWFGEHLCAPDVLGVNYYVTSDRWLDHRVGQYPERSRSDASADAFVDIEAVRVMAVPKPGIGALLEEAWDRYHLPIAITEAHLDAGREDQMRWLLEIWRAAQSARRHGADVRAVTAWSLLGSFDWNELLTNSNGYYEPGPFDTRSEPPRPTALATLITELASGKAPSHTLLLGDGWWRSPARFIRKPVAPRAPIARLSGYRREPVSEPMRPILISGAAGTLGKAFAIVCGERNVSFQLLSRSEMDIADPESVATALARLEPWAVINASGYVRIDEAETDVERCFRENATGPAVLADQCAKRGVALLTFSSEQVFGGRSVRPWLESDTPSPLNCYGRSKAAAERAVMDAWPKALVVRTSAFFGPWDSHNFVVHALSAMEAGRDFRAADDVRVSPAYLPDLVNVSLDLLIDGEAGLWHLANGGDVSWFGFARMVGEAAKADTRLLRPAPSTSTVIAARPRYGVLGSERATGLMPRLEAAVAHFVQCRADAAAAAALSASAVRAAKRQDRL